MTHIKKKHSEWFGNQTFVVVIVYWRELFFSLCAGESTGDPTCFCQSRSAKPAGKASPTSADSQKIYILRFDKKKLFYIYSKFTCKLILQHTNYHTDPIQIRMQPLWSKQIFKKYFNLTGDIFILLHFHNKNPPF